MNIDAPRVQAPQLSKSDSPQVHIPLSTDNNKGSSPKSPPKPTQNLVHTKDEEGIEKGRPKRTIVKPIRYRDVNSTTNIISVHSVLYFFLLLALHLYILIQEMLYCISTGLVQYRTNGLKGLCSCKYISDSQVNIHLNEHL